MEYLRGICSNFYFQKRDDGDFLTVTVLEVIRRVRDLYIF
jgi:hypothetical protein